MQSMKFVPRAQNCTDKGQGGPQKKEETNHNPYMLTFEITSNNGSEESLEASFGASSFLGLM